MSDAMQPYIDLDTALSRVRGNKKLYRKMLDLFSQSTEFAALEESLAANNYEKAASDAHAIKGMTGNLALTAVFDTSSQILMELRDGSCSPETYAAYQQALKKTRECVAQLCIQLDAQIDG